MFVIDLTLCQAEGSRMFHGGGEYGKYAAIFILSRARCKVVVFFKKGVSPEISEFGDEPNVEFRVLSPGQEFVLPPELDREEVKVLLPLPYSYLKRYTLPRKASVWATIHGLREMDMMRAKVEGIPIEPLGDQHIARDSLLFLWEAVIRRRYNRRLDKKQKQYMEAISKLQSKDRLLVTSDYTEWAIKRFTGGRQRTSVCKAPPLSPFMDVRGQKRDVEGVRADEVRVKSGLIMLSAERPEKNLKRVFMAIESSQVLTTRLAEEGVVITGSEDYLRTLPNRLAECVPLIKIPYCDAGKLNKLIREARMLVYPTLNEGFGIPPVEAMRVGTPVLASPVTSIAEVLGEAAIYANPLDSGEIATRLYQMFEDHKKMDAMRARGYERFRGLQKEVFRSWETLWSNDGL